MRRWAGLLLLLALGSVLLITVTTFDPRSATTAATAPTPSPGPADPFARPVILEADAYGALLLDTASSQVVGVDAAGVVRWRDRLFADRMYVSCLAHCPDAVASGSFDEDAPPPPVIWRTGVRRTVDPPAAAVVLWADSPAEALVVRSTAGRGVLEIRNPRRTSVYPVQGVNPRFFLAPDRSRALVLTTGALPTVRTLDRTRIGWTISPALATSATGACIGPAGTPAVLYDSTTASLLEAPDTTPRPLPLQHVGRCRTGTDRVLAQRFTQDSSSGARTTTRLLDSSGRLLWMRTDPGIHPAYLDPATGRVLLLTDTEMILAAPDGSVLDRAAGVVDAQFVNRGCLLALHRDLHTTRRCLTTANR
ncbi:hypothetical protein ABZ721_31915 [Streptomyces sp. NPDC006733]|uniref:hypothetical protein n=1 Tax=Streptomyces sp. NPDC006733 TaxID=3155460 RepID=UPI0033FAC309